MAKKYIFSGHDVVVAAYVNLVQQKQIPSPPKGFIYDWDVALSDPEDKASVEVTFTLTEREPKPTPEHEKPYEAGDWIEDEN